MGRLDGKVCIVTGVSRGIGKAIAEVFAAEGGRLACVARTLHEGDHQLEGSLDVTVRAIEEAGGEAFPIAADLAEHEDCIRLVEEARAHFGPIDVLVNNAALTWYINIRDYPVSRWHRSLAVNLHAPFYLSQLVLPDMLARGRGAIVNISSGSARGPGRGPYPERAENMAGNTVYGTGKAALDRFTQGLASEVYRDGITVAAVGPSQVVMTPGTIHHGYFTTNTEPAEYMAKAALLLATEPIDRTTGRVTYSQRVLADFGWLPEAKGPEELYFPVRPVDPGN